MIGNALQFARPAVARAEFGRAAELARAVGEDWALLHANLDPAFGMTFSDNHARARNYVAAADDVIKRVGEPYDLGRRLMFVGHCAADQRGRLEEATRPPIAARRRAADAGADLGGRGRRWSG